jgi:hypothetical protein
MGRGGDPQAEKEWSFIVLAQQGHFDKNKKVSINLNTIFLNPLDTQMMEGANKLDQLFRSNVGLSNFIKLFADGIERGEFEALLVKSPPVPRGGTVEATSVIFLTKQQLLELDIN